MHNFKGVSGDNTLGERALKEKVSALMEKVSEEKVLGEKLLRMHE